ncbi:MAG: hypothetical protein PF542_06110 [Nanoarchaeota archaeon]|jgi:hypothetical protein|nr:hypothetical protein [Nanoarchaeota archaeon]
MLPNNIISALKTFYDKINNKQILWILTGSTSLVIQGVDIKINDDIDILTDKQGSEKIDILLADFRIKKPDYSSTDKYKSYFGIYQIGNVKLEVMGEFQYKMNDGYWSHPNHLNVFFIKEFEGMKLAMLRLDQELQEYENMGRPNKVDKIKEFLRRSNGVAE